MATFIHLLLKLGISLLLAFLPLFHAIGQHEKGPGKMKIKVIRERNGNVEVLDTTVSVSGAENFAEVARALRIDTAAIKALHSSKLKSGYAFPVPFLADSARLQRLREARIHIITADSMLHGQHHHLELQRASALAGDSAVKILLRKARAGRMVADSVLPGNLRLMEVLRFGDSTLVQELRSGVIFRNMTDSVHVLQLNDPTILRHVKPVNVERIIVEKRKFGPGDTLHLQNSREKFRISIDDKTGERKVIRIDADGKEQELNVNYLDIARSNTTDIIMVNFQFKEVLPEDKEALKAAGAPVETTLNEELSVEEISFYPNPSNGRFNVAFTLENKGNTTIRVMDSTGRQVFSDQVKKLSGEYKREIDLSSHGRGIYFLQIAQGKRYYTKKVVVQ